MKSFLLFLLASAATISFTSSCSETHDPVCGRVKNTNTCRTFKNPCKFDLFNNGDYEEVDFNYCVDRLRIVPCLIRNIPISRTCGTTCAPYATAHVCACQVNATESCKYFRNQCELDNNKCDNSQTLYEMADKLKCHGLSKYRITP